MNDPIDNLRERNWRRKLTPAEHTELRAWLAAHPGARADWEIEAGLAELLEKLPAAPVPTNFTARVLEVVRRETAAGQRRAPKWKWLLHSLLPKAAVAAVILGAGLIGFHQREAARRVRLARSVAVVSEVALLPNPEVLQDFDVIRQMNQPPQADAEMLALLQ